jgi:A/G-specific adenine glycosylase
VDRWGETHRRHLPWRDTRDPWAVLVSEVMLQQTQAQRVIEPYARFLERFPTPAVCAASEVGDVLRLWGGLGYNRRAVYLRRAAQAIVERFGGQVPSALDELKSLPGVGSYTARAVLAFAFEHDVGVVDTNVRRVLARAVAGAPLSAFDAQRLADELVGPGAGWAHNQAMLDLGATHCTAQPNCTGCPLRRACAWGERGWCEPDPAQTPESRRQARFSGSDRQGRGRLVSALLRRPLAGRELALAAGWPDDDARARRIAESLVSEGMAMWSEEDALALA